MDYWSKVMLLAGAIGVVLLIVGITLNVATVVPGIVLVVCAKVGWIVLAFVVGDPSADDDGSTSGWT